MNTMAILTDIMTNGGRIELGFSHPTGGSDTPGVYYATVSHGHWKSTREGVGEESIPALVANAYALWDEYRNNQPK